MDSIKLLDCTLRDGGYVNHWRFGRQAIPDILSKLVLANMDFIECGYLSQKKGGDPDVAQFATLDDLAAVLPSKQPHQRFAIMINFGEYDDAALPSPSGDAPVIRVCFHKKDRAAAVAYCGRLVEKGYTVFLQPMAILNYSDGEYVELIREANAIKVRCFYIVDSFGVMETKDLLRLQLVADRNLDPGIALGYHSHNNLQQAYGNAKMFVEQHLSREIVIDASVFGIGRGAGNLNMELFADYLNRQQEKAYRIEPLLDIMDEHLQSVFRETPWGYSLPFYFSAKNNCHPNYALFFSQKNTLSNRSLEQLLASLPPEVKSNYSADTAETYYQKFQEQSVDDKEVVSALLKHIGTRPVLILAPGKSLETERETIAAFIRDNDPVVFAINVASPHHACDYLFCTNEKRLAKLEVPPSARLLLTSNLRHRSHDALILNYASYLDHEGLIADNPTLMLLQLFSLNGIKETTLAGFDGYSPNPDENYFASSLSLGSSIAVKLRKNELIRSSLERTMRNMDVHFLTPSLYVPAAARDVPQRGRLA